MQSFLKLLATVASKITHRQQLIQLSEVTELYETWKSVQTPNLLEVLEEFPSLKVPPSLIMVELPLLKLRYYSISSSPLVTPDQIHATITVVRYRTQDGAGPIHDGVCSTWLNCCDIGEIVPCIVRPYADFRMPDDMTLPVVMVGTGSGIAPFKSFWQHRKIDKEMHIADGNESWGTLKLYFGCRKPKENFLYETELQQMKTEGILDDYYVAFSREEGKQKVYVQDLLLKNEADVFNDIFMKEGHFYVCGNVKMASDVIGTLEKILQEQGSLSADSANEYIIKLQYTKRLHKDIFGIQDQQVEHVDDHADRMKNKPCETLSVPFVTNTFCCRGRPSVWVAGCTQQRVEKSTMCSMI
ncbi:nitric oxide synthase, inducible-like [Gigantopelta aegis]|uniref:nitric oxide synthase, inducible-like n=1 Tax=Gigantopelta aegis TaxID=1735272 RepID=UPI001B88A882|nr:nitric oxide synthase, inducible-like [Gigantopelta aegis]